MGRRHQLVAQDLKDRLQHRTLTAFLQHISPTDLNVTVHDNEDAQALSTTVNNILLCLLNHQGGGFVKWLTRCIRSTKLPYASPVRTWMGDHQHMGEPSQYVTSNSVQLSLAIPPWVYTISSSDCRGTQTV